MEILGRMLPISSIVLKKLHDQLNSAPPENLVHQNDKMADLKTQPTRKSVSKLLGNVESAERKQDCQTILELMQTATGEKPVIWGENIIGFGQYQYQQKSGQTGRWPLTGFSPRKQNISIYIMPGFSSYQSQLKKLGKHKHSVSCLYITKLSQVDVKVLQEIVVDSVRVMRERYSDPENL